MFFNIQTEGSHFRLLWLNEDDLRCFRERGWCLLRAAVPSKEAEAFKDEELKPALRGAGVDPDLCDTWHRGEKYEALWNKAKANSNRYGAHLRLPDPGIELPVSLFAPEGRLRQALDQLLLPQGAVNEDKKASSESSSYVAPDPQQRLRNTVLRYPQAPRRGLLGWFYLKTLLALRCSLLPILGWHVDGYGWQHHLHSAGQALVALPIFMAGGSGRFCGGTALVEGSHIAVASFLSAAEPRGYHYLELFVLAHLLSWAARLPVFLRRPAAWLLSWDWLPKLRLEEARDVQAGDVLLMHPMLAHSSAENELGTAIRVAHNVRIQWARDLGLQRGSVAQRCSEVEATLLEASSEVPQNVLLTPSKNLGLFLVEGVRTCFWKPIDLTSSWLGRKKGRD